ncbi:MAG TPA: hypothetical protein HPQ00_09475, partial [Magnetococcales bacterium]|nr:hypothetical protein [Magnetococcales bacterium]
EEVPKGKSKKKPEEKITLGLAPVVIEEKKAGLPDRIKKLPKNHPERVLYEKGYKEREHKEWVEASKRRRQAVRRVDKLLIAEVFVFVLAVGSLYYGILKYVDKVDYTRGEIIKVLKHKQYSLRDPKISDDFQYLHMVNWLPRLNDLFVKAKSLEFNYDTLDDNPEEGTYLDYIRRHKKPFDEREAMAWRIREVRKPKSAHD